MWYNMLMDNMAYLQQIAGVNNSMNSKAKGNSPLSKLLNVWTFVGIGIFIALIIGLAVLVSALNKVDTKDQDLMTRSYWMAHFLIENTFNEYADQVKNSDIRNMTASFKSVLNEIVVNEQAIMLDEFDLKVDDYDEDDNPIVAEEHEHNDKLNQTLEDARLNGILDRVFLREIAMQIAYMRSYQSEIAERTTSEAAKEFSLKADANLGNLYDQFHNFRSLAI